ncbi:MAG: DUF4446 family protein [Anaerolineae bacterium]|nr:DUF4446 family protein [Anaerolineae bacterium]
MDTTQLIWIIAVTVLTLLNIVWQFDLQTRQRRLREQYTQLRDTTDGVNLQINLEALMAQIEELQGKAGRLEALAAQMQTTLGHTVQGFGMVRFQAFSGTGGDQSFALALVDAVGNGIVLSALYAREGTRVYGKPLVAWTSTYNMGDEEQEAIAQARQMLTP